MAIENTRQLVQWFESKVDTISEKIGDLENQIAKRPNPDLDLIDAVKELDSSLSELQDAVSSFKQADLEKLPSRAVRLLETMTTALMDFIDYIIAEVAKEAAEK